MSSPSPLSSPLPIVPALPPGSSANATLPMDMAPPSSSPPAQSVHSAIWAIWASYELRFKTADVWMLPYRSRDIIFDILWDILRNKQLIPDNVFEPDQQFSVRTEVKYCGKRLDIAATTVRSADHHALELDLGANICLIVEVMAAAAGAGERLYLDSFQVRNVNKEIRDNAEGSATAGIPVGTTLTLIGFLGPFFTVCNWRYGRMSKDNGFWDIRICRGQRKLQRVLASFGVRSETHVDKLDNLVNEGGTAETRTDHSSPAAHVQGAYAADESESGTERMA